MTENTTKATRRTRRSLAAASNAIKEQPSSSAGAAAENEQGSPAPRGARESKIAIVTRLLRQEHGANLDELIIATGWQPHTTRAALTGLRKKGHAISKDKVDGVTRYTISAAPQS